MARNTDYLGDTSGSQMPGLSGTASAFQSGVGKRKQPQKPQQGQQDQSSQKKKGGGGLGGAIKKGMGALFGGGKQAPAASAPGAPIVPNTTAMSAGLPASTPVLKRGGRIKRGGVALLHRGERVIPAGKSRGGRKRAGGKQHTITKA